MRVTEDVTESGSILREAREATNDAVALVEMVPDIVAQLVAVHGSAAATDATTGVERVARAWRKEDGPATAFEDFCVQRFVPMGPGRSLLRDRIEHILDLLDGHLGELQRSLRRWRDLRVEPCPAVDDIAARLDPAPDRATTLHRQGLAPLILLHFAPPNLSTMLEDGASWSTDQWAEARLAGAVGPRVPVEVSEQARSARQSASAFVDGFQVPVDGLVDASGTRVFEPGRRLVAHWLIREQIRAGYDDPAGQVTQRQLAAVMGRTVDGSIPAAVMRSGRCASWDPVANTVGSDDASEFVGPARYAHWLHIARTERALDRYYPVAPSALERANALRREMPTSQVTQLLESVLTAPGRVELAAFVASRVRRPLASFDIYFDRVRETAHRELWTSRVAERYPNAAALESAVPQLLLDLGFDAAAAARYGDSVRVEIARGAGHASGPRLRDADAWLRTNALTGSEQLGWDGYDIAIHELGHNIEQLISAREVPRPALRGVPNAACSEAFAFLFQARAGELLGVESGDHERARDEASVSQALAAWQIAGAALVEQRAWEWIYQHDDPTPQALQDCVLALCDETWAAGYEEFFGPDPHHLLGAYQHMIAYPLYLPSYVIGHAIAHQVRRHVERGSLADEMQRMCAIGRLSPRAWMQRAVGADVDPELLMREGAAAASRLRTSRA